MVVVSTYGVVGVAGDIDAIRDGDTIRLTFDEPTAHAALRTTVSLSQSDAVVLLYKLLDALLRSP